MYPPAKHDKLIPCTTKTNSNLHKIVILHDRNRGAIGGGGGLILLFGL